MKSCMIIAAYLALFVDFEQVASEFVDLDCACDNPQWHREINIDFPGVQNIAFSLMANLSDKGISGMMAKAGVIVDEPNKGFFGVDDVDKCYVGSMENMNVKWTDGGGEAIVDVTLMGSAKENGIVASICTCKEWNNVGPSRLCKNDNDDGILAAHFQVMMKRFAQVFRRSQ